MKFTHSLLLISVLFAVLAGCTQTGTSEPSQVTTQPTAWLSGEPGSVNLTPTDGSGPFQCDITAGSLPVGFTLNNCIISGTAPILNGGTTESISSPITITITDASGNKQNLVYNILTVASLPEIVFNEPSTCVVNEECRVALIFQVDGGTEPYYFQSDTFANGAPPLGMIVDLNGILTGTPTVKGTYTFGVCVVDVAGASQCGQTSVIVEEEEPLPSAGSSGLCSSDSDCTGFGQSYCDAPGNVRCGGDGLCHCCLTLCPGGENCECIDCSTGCGGGTYCEGDVCVFEVGGEPL